MRSIFRLILTTLIFVSVGSALYAQDRTSGKLVVPHGWEDQDSIRVGLFDLEFFYKALGGTDTVGYIPTKGVVASIADSLMSNIEYCFGDPIAGPKPLGKIKQSMFSTDLNAFTQRIKQRYYYALPFALPIPWGAGFRWRYNAANFDPGTQYYNNTYDANDISPYSYYPALHDTVIKTISTRRWLGAGNTVVDSTLAVGEVGKPILAYSDDRLTTNLVRTLDNGFIPAGRSAGNFSITLEFNVDTTIAIDTALLGLRDSSDLPLMRVQLLFKKGLDGSAGWPVKPFAPFREATHPSTRGGGWYKVIDQVVTLNTYHNLRYSWRREDVLENGNASHTWKFKQLHLLFQDIPTSLRTLISSSVNSTRNDATDWNRWGQPSESGMIMQNMHPDSIVAVDSTTGTADIPLIEIRILSTYRLPIRVRGLAYQDTIADKFLYRARISGDSTHSLNPDGSIGGYDEKVDSLIAAVKTAHPNSTIEFLLNDEEAVSPGIAHQRAGMSFATMGYMDYMGRKHGIYPHYREQEWDGNIILHLRRNRMVYDGATPSMFENQSVALGADKMFPRDYVAFTSPSRDSSNTPAPHYRHIGLDITKNTALSGDTLAAYKSYTSSINGIEFFHKLRHGTRNALAHPKDRRMAYEWSLLPGIMHYRWKWLPDSGVSHLTIFDSTTSTTTTATKVYDTVAGDYKFYRTTWWQPGLPEGPPGSVSSPVVFKNGRIINGVIYDTIHHGSNGKDTTEIRSYAALRWLDTIASGYWAYRCHTPEEWHGMFFSALANGCSSFSNANPVDLPVIDIIPRDEYGNLINSNELAVGGGTPGLWGLTPKTSPAGPPWALEFPDHSRNFGHDYSAVWYSQWTLRDTNDMCGNLPDFYLGYSNSWRAWQRVFGRINQIYDSTSGRTVPHPFKYLTWKDAYSQCRTARPFTRYYHSDPRLLLQEQEDSISRASAFLKVSKTQLVRPWGSKHGSYVDSVIAGAPVIDPDTTTYVEVGLFLDSISTTSKNYAALVVNTRLYPTLNDEADSTYYNEGLTKAKDRSRSILGDIDVRKVYLKIDTSQFPSSFRNYYYVVRDLWHSDSTWLVQRDSEFAIYLKPGDAKFLYFEKGVAIDVAHRTGADSGKSTKNEFCFNNGRRVAERIKRTRDVVCYTRDHKLYVSYPAKGETIAGYAERSGKDNLATGCEEILDTGTCARPSISTAFNDTSVALVYWKKDTLSFGHLVMAYQRTPGASWQILDSVGGPGVVDTSIDYSHVTPVITPVDDTTWFVAYAKNDLTAVPGIYGLKFTTPASRPPYLVMPTSLPWIVFHSSGSNGSTLFPTVSSRPLPDSLYPVRLAWQWDSVTPGFHQIYYTRIRNAQLSTSSQYIHDSVLCISRGLAACDNLHPSIALNGTKQYLYGIKTVASMGGPGGALFPFAMPTPSISIPIITYYDDNVAWESKLRRPGENSAQNYWPVIHARHERRDPSIKPGFWGLYDVFPLDTMAGDFHYPQIAAQPRVYTGAFTYNSKKVGVGFHDWIRMAWQDKGDQVKFASWLPSWQGTILAKTSSSFELGYLPSIPQSADSMTHWADSSTVPRSVVFVSNVSGTKGYSYVRATNAWFPFASRMIPAAGFHVADTSMVLDEPCKAHRINIRVEKGTLIPHDGLDPVSELHWSSADVSQGGPHEDWSPSAGLEEAIHTDIFSIKHDDSISVPRQVRYSDITAIQNGLASTSDFLTFKLTLRHWADSSLIATIDSLVITKTGSIWPGVTPGLDSSFVSYKLPSGHVADTVFIAAELVRGDSTDLLSRYYVEELTPDVSIPPPAYKRNPPAHTVRTGSLSLSITPNPFNPVTHLQVEAIEGQLTSVEVYDLLGRRVRTLFSEAAPAGTFPLDLDGSDLASGSYLVRVQSGDQLLTKRIELLR